MTIIYILLAASAVSFGLWFRRYDRRLAREDWQLYLAEGQRALKRQMITDRAWEKERLYMPVRHPHDV